MPSRELIANLLLAALAAVALGLSGYAVWSVRQPVSASSSTLTGAAPTADGSQVTADNAATTSTAEADESDEETQGPSDDAHEATLGGWVSAWSGEADLLVIGDGYSSHPTQWVQLWASDVAQDRPVVISHWGEAAEIAFNDPIVLSEGGGGSSLAIWSASRDESTIGAAAERYQLFVSSSALPDAVLVSLGQNSADEDIAAALDELVGQIDADVPVLLTIGPEGLYEAGVTDSLREWAEENGDRASVVDLRSSLDPAATAEQWATAFGEAVNNS